MSIIEASVFKNPQQLVSNQFCLTRIDALARYVKVQKIINNGTGPAIARLEGGGGGGSEYCSSVAARKGKLYRQLTRKWHSTNTNTRMSL